MEVLYIESSPRKQRSSSIAVAKEFIDEYRKIHPGDQIVTLDLWKRELPPFDGDTIDAKYAIMHNHDHSPEQAKAWRAVEEIIGEFKKADKYIISLPMWNFGIPYRLKHYIDILVQPSYTFTSSKQGFQGLVTGKPVVLIYARGGAYQQGTGAEAYDLQKHYMESILKFIGFEDISSIIIEPTLGSGGPEQKEELVARAKKEARQLAADFGHKKTRRSL